PATARAPSSAGAPANFHGYCAAQRLARRSPFLPSSATAPPIRVKKKTPAASPELTENELNRKKARPPAAPPPRAAPHGHIIVAEATGVKALPRSSVMSAPREWCGRSRPDPVGSQARLPDCPCARGGTSGPTPDFPLTRRPCTSRNQRMARTRSARTAPLPGELPVYRFRMTRFRVVDAFTDRAFAGNPAAVLILDQPYTDGWAQQVAAEFNLSETAFARRLPPGAAGQGAAGAADYELRWFTPAVEVDLCGHATLATAHALAEDGVRGTVRFATRSSGVLTVAERDGTLWMDFPANPPAPAGVPAGLAGALGAEPVRAAAAGTGDLLVELASEEA